MSESTSLREAIAKLLHADGQGVEWDTEYPSMKHRYLGLASEVLELLENQPAYLALDLWMALGLSSRDFDAYLERNGWADTWANLLDGVRRKSGRRGCSKHTETPRERCVLIAGHVGPCMGASDVGSSERLPGAAFGGEQA